MCSVDAGADGVEGPIGQRSGLGGIAGRLSSGPINLKGVLRVRGSI